MAGYAGVVMLLNSLVQSLLLLGTARSCHCFVPWQKILLSGMLGGLYAGVCLLSKYAFLGANSWRMVVLVVMVILSFGFSRESVRSGAVFVLLNMALEGITLGSGQNNPAMIAFAVLIIAVLCFLSFRRRNGGGMYIPVELFYMGEQYRLTALHDTGNMLTDPLTGESVLVVDANTAGNLTGLTAQQLAKPLEAMMNQSHPGLRLIPYKTIGQKNSFLLALRMQGKVGEKAGKFLVAFAPEGVFGDGKYQALAGGVV